MWRLRRKQTSLGRLGSAAAALIATSANAQDLPPRPDTSQWKCERCPFARGLEANYELGAAYVSDDAARFGNATGYDEQGGYAVAAGDGQYIGEDQQVHWSASDLGLQSRTIEVDGGKPGSYEYGVQWSELPYRRFDTTATVFRRADAQTLALPEDWVRAGTTDGFTTLGTSLIDRDIASDRRSLAMSGKYSGVKRLTLRADYRRTERDGYNIVGGSFFNSTALLPAPFDERTETVDLGVGYEFERGSMELSWTGSTFDNLNRAWRWENPYIGAAQGQLAQAPDNQAQTITLAGVHQLGWNSVVSWSAATGEIKQDESLLAYSIDPTLAATLPRDRLDGQVDTRHLDLRLTSRPWEHLRLKGVYRYDERDNRTPIAAWSRVITDLFASGESETNRPYSFERSRLELSAATNLNVWDWLKPFEFEAGYQRTQTDRDLQEAAEQTEDGGWGRVRWRKSAAEVSLRAGALRRDIDRYDLTRAPASEQNPLLRKYNLAYRFRDFVELRTTLAWPDRPITIGGEFFYATDDYTESPLGLRKSDDRRLAADVTWTLSERITTYLQGGYEDLESRSVGSESFAQPDWEARHADRFRTIGAGVDFGRSVDRFRARLAFTYAQGTGNVDVTSTLSAGGAYPKLETDLRNAVLDLDYRLSNSLDLRWQLRYEDFSSSDWALAGVDPATIPTVLTLGADPYDYQLYVTSLSFRYYFGGASTP